MTDTGGGVGKFLSTPSARRATPRPPEPDRLSSISIHALREEGDSRTHTTLCRQHNFYPRPPRGGRRHLVHLLDGGIDISIHALREEGDRSWSLPFGWSGHFYPRPPRGGRHVVVDERLTGQGISIHALREEGDAFHYTGTVWLPYFYPRPPRGGRLSANTV